MPCREAGCSWKSLSKDQLNQELSRLEMINDLGSIGNTVDKNLMELASKKRYKLDERSG